jgi:hypothetical protein
MAIKTCLLVKIDNKCFLTHEKHLQSLIEFAKTFKARISLVKAESSSILTLEELAKKICENAPASLLDYKVIRPDIFDNNPKLKKMVYYTSFSPALPKLRLANRMLALKKFIYESFKSGGEVVVKDIEHDFKKEGLSISTVYRCLRSIKEDLSKDGYKVIKIVPGRYRCQLK